jgi:hypothetical protein
VSDEPAPRVIWSPRGNRAQLRLMKCQVFEIFFGGARGGSPFRKLSPFDSRSAANQNMIAG